MKKTQLFQSIFFIGVYGLFLLFFACGKSELNFQSKGTLTGTIINGSTSDAIVAGARVTHLYNGATVDSDLSGNFSFSEKLSIGTHSFSVSHEDFASQNINISIKSGSNTKTIPLLEAEDATNRIAIILTWGSTPKDLDSHLYVPHGENSTYHIYYGQKTDSNDSSRASLDVDDQSGDGPETVTIKFENGSTSYYEQRNWRYYVVNYLMDASFDTQMEVKVYKNGDFIKSYPGKATSGKYWHVFDMAHDGSLTDYDDYSDSTPDTIYGSLL